MLQAKEDLNFFMKNSQKLITLLAMSALGVSFLMAGCAHEISRTEETHVSPTGRVTTNEKVVTENPDGTINQTETHKSVRP